MTSTRTVACLLILAAGATEPLARAQDPNGQPQGVDAMGDPLPNGALLRLGSMRLRHDGFGSRIAYSRDGVWLASGGEDSVVRLWDARTGKEVRQFRGSDEGTIPVTFSANSAYDSIGRLLSSPQAALSLLRERVKPVPEPDHKQIARWIADLDSQRFAIRDQAQRNLEKLAELAAPAMREALGRSPSLEWKRRLQGLLDKAEAAFPPQMLRSLRAIEVLECLATVEARGLLEALSRGTPAARITAEAKASLSRLQRP